jgi:hypothetical protein
MPSPMRSPFLPRNDAKCESFNRDVRAGVMGVGVPTPFSQS